MVKRMIWKNTDSILDQQAFLFQSLQLHKLVHLHQLKQNQLKKQLNQLRQKSNLPRYNQIRIVPREQKTS